MPVTINGSGSITGLAVGGLPDGSVDADTIAANAVTTTKIANSAVTSVKTSGLGVITMAEQWRLQSPLQGNRTPMTGWNVVNTGNAGKIGSSMSESSGVFTFPSTGIYLIMLVLQGYSDSSTQNLIGNIQTTTNNSSWTGVAYSQNGIYDYNNSYPSHSNGMNTHIFDVENTSTHKVRFS